jgi:membrane-associated protein
MEDLIRTGGYLLVFGFVFAESGLLIGFFLPGDSLLFTAGFLASLPEPVFSLPVLVIGVFIAAVTGDSVGYAFGRRVGRKLFQREDSLLFHKKNLISAQNFYEKHGGKTIVIARFMPIVRTFAPIVAGIGVMNYRRFLSYNIVGGLLWGVGVTVAGYFLGRVIPEQDVDKYLLPIIAVIILISVAPPAYHVLKDKETRDALWKTGRGIINEIWTKLFKRPLLPEPQKLEEPEAEG